MSEGTRIRTFICRQLRDAPDLSTLTLGILKKRYLTCVGRESLSPESKHILKRVVEEELLKMQDSDEEESESPKKTTAMPHQNKRKREEGNEEVINGKGNEADGSKAKKLRHRSSSSESMDSVSEKVEREEDKLKVKKEKGNCETRQEDSEEGEESEEEEQIAKSGDAEQRVSKSQGANLQRGMSEEEAESEDCTEEGTNGSRKRKQTKTFLEGDSDDDNDSDSDDDDESDGNEKQKTKGKAKKPIKSRAKTTSKKKSHKSEDCTEEGTNGSRKRKQTKTFLEGDSDDDNDSDSDDDNESDGNEKQKTKGKAKKPIKSRAKTTSKKKSHTSGDAEQRVSKSKGANLQRGLSEEEAESEDCTEEGTNGSRKRKQTKTFLEGDSDDDNDSDSDDDNESDGNKKRKTKGKAKKPIKSRAKRARKTSKEKKPAPSQQTRGNRSDSDGEEEDTGQHNSNDSSEEEGGKERKVLTEKTNDASGQDSDSSPLPSLEDEPASGGEKTQRTKKKTVAKKDGNEKVSKGEKEEDKAVLRLKRYIALCGVRRNYKKLLDGCRSVRSMVAVLKRELEELGVQGQPSIEKCKKARLKREEAQELAELDIGNIITTEGRPKRRRASAWQEQPVPASSAYKRIVNSESDDDSPSGRGRRRATDWSNLQGIISDDGDSG